MQILGIETSCDETGVAIYDEEKGLIANQLHTQIALHADYGGVVPELASRDHIHKLAPLYKPHLKKPISPPKTLTASLIPVAPAWLVRCW